MNTKERTDPNKFALIRNLKGISEDKKAPIWKKLAKELSRTNRNRTVVNLSRLNRVTSSGDVLLIPGKVLGAGSLNHNVIIAAESFSDTAREKIIDAGGTCLTIEDLIKKHPKGSHVRLIK